MCDCSIAVQVLSRRTDVDLVNETDLLINYKLIFVESFLNIHEIYFDTILVKFST